jgi:rhamnogalacturonan endolyase
MNNEMRYFLHEVINGVENPVPIAEYTLPAYDSATGTSGLNYIEIPMKPVQGALNADNTWVYSATSTDNTSTYAYIPNDASFADLDGDGEMEIVIHRVGPNSQDNANSGKTDAPVLQAYKLDGTFLWEINLGINIREGAHYTQFMVYDLDGNGKAEVVCKTAEGAIDAAGTYVGEKYFPDYVKTYSLGSRTFNPNANYRNSNGYILQGPEFLTVFNGETGTEIVTTAYDPPRYSSIYNNGNEIPVMSPSTSDINSLWGDNYGNRVDRFLACIAYLDGIHPNVVMCRGYYTRTVLVAYDFDGTQLTKRWKFDTRNASSTQAAYAGQGNHNLRVGDVDGDGKDEIIYGSCAIDDNGTGLYNTKLGHGDAIHLTDFDPARPGLEVVAAHENTVSGSTTVYQGVTYRDARTGEVLFQKTATADDGRAMGTAIMSSYRGMEFWSAHSGSIISTSQKAIIVNNTNGVSMNMACWWDGDLLRELQDGTSVTKYNSGSAQILLNPSGTASNNGSKANPCIVADILGDWREEVVLRTINNKAIRIYMTDQTTNFRFHTFLQDPIYRLSIAYQNVAYNQPTHTGFYMGTDLQNIFVPASIEVAGNVNEYVIDPFFDAIWYQWSDGTISKTDTLRRTGFPEDGTAKKVILTMNYHGYLFSDSINVSFAPSNSAVKTVTKSGITLLTNPVNDMMKIAFDEAGLYDCYFYDLTGRLTMKTTIPVSGTSIHSIDVSGLPSGAGIVEIKNNKLGFTGKFLKK